MDFEKKLKTRLYIAVIYAALGVIMIVGSGISGTDNEFISPFGLGLLVCAIVRVRNYFMITRNEETLRKQRVAETDERNLLIVNKARSVTFFLYMLISGTAIIILSLFGKPEPAKMIAYSVCTLLVIYYISYIIIRKKS